MRQSLEEIIIELKKIHNNKFDYSKFNITRMKEKGIIICPEHGEFIQSGYDHKRSKTFV